MRLSDESVMEGGHLTPEERIALQAEEIKQLWQENNDWQERYYELDAGHSRLFKDFCKLQQENEQLQAQVARMREVLEQFKYDYWQRGGEKMQTLTIRIPDWMRLALRQVAHDKHTSINQVCADIFYDALVTTVIDETIVSDKAYRIVRAGNRYAIVWGDEFTDLIPAVQVVSPELGVVWFNTREAAIAEASVLKEE